MKLGICGWGERFLTVFFFLGGGSGVFFFFLGWVGGMRGKSYEDAGMMVMVTLMLLLLLVKVMAMIK